MIGWREVQRGGLGEEVNLPAPKRMRIHGKSRRVDAGWLGATVDYARISLSSGGRLDRLDMNLLGVARQGDTRA